jgi:hypothetical protein
MFLSLVMDFFIDASIKQHNYGIKIDIAVPFNIVPIAS